MVGHTKKCTRHPSVLATVLMHIGRVTANYALTIDTHWWESHVCERTSHVAARIA